jgi:hypothetical protein
MTPRDKSSKVIVEVDFRPGNPGNKMLQDMAVVKLCDRIGSERISNASIPEFGVKIRKTAEKVQPFRLPRYHSKVTARLDFDRISEIVAKGRIDKVVLSIYSSVIANLPPLDMPRHLFPLKEGVSGYGEFVPSQGAVHDFSAVSKSRNTVTAASMFSRLAGWLSRADRAIMPPSGFLNPLQHPQVDLIPSADSRFSFYLFPKNHAVKDADILEAHRALKGTWRKIDEDEDEDEVKSIKSQSQVKPTSPGSTLHFLARSGARYLSISPRRLLRKFPR